MSLFQYAKTWFERSLTEADINSRFVFLIHGLGSCVGVLALTIAFIIAKDKEYYAIMAGTVGGTGVAAAAGRYMTKRDGGTPPPAKVE